jgi:hypothetical protein
MQKQNLTRASRELFSRSPDERFETLDDLWRHCREDKERSSERWHSPSEIKTLPNEGRLKLEVGEAKYKLNDWSFSQVCKIAGVGKDTLNQLSPDTASLVLGETFPNTGKPLQAWTGSGTVRSLHGASYTRLYNADLLSMVKEFATDFSPPQRGMNGATGLYCGEQDMFVFLIDPAGWAEIEGQAFAPGFFLWNSEVGRRSIGIQSFWFQAICQNHIVWDAVEVIEFSRKHTTNVHECFTEIRRILESLIEKRDARRDGFSKVIAKAFVQTLGEDAESVAKILQKHGVPRDFGKQALKLAEVEGRFTIFSVVDALTKLAQKYENAGDRAELDQTAGKLLSLAV